MNNILADKSLVFCTLVKNEIKKLISKRIVFCVFLVLIVGLLVLAVKIDGEYELTDYNNLNDYIQDELYTCYDTLNDPNMTFSEIQKNTIIDQVRVYEYMLENGIEPYRTKSITNYILSLNSWFAIVVLLSIVISGKVITDEYKEGTMALLLTVPCKRSQILLSKILALLIICTAIILCFFVFSVLIGGIFFGFSGIANRVVTCENGVVSCHSTLVQVMIKNIHNFFALLSCSSFTMMLATVFKSGIISTSASVSLYFAGAQLTVSLYNMKWMKYSLFANMQLSVFEKWSSIFEYRITERESILILSTYTIVFFLVAFLVFDNRNIYE